MITMCQTSVFTILRVTTFHLILLGGRGISMRCHKHPAHNNAKENLWRKCEGNNIFRQQCESPAHDPA